MSTTLNPVDAAMAMTQAMPWRVTRLTEQALAGLGSEWNSLTDGVPFRSWEWLATWWRHYGATEGDPRRPHELYILGVYDHANVLVGIAPWYVDNTRSHSRIVRFLGSGEVCSEYLTVLCRSQCRERVAAILAAWLVSRSTCAKTCDPADRWDILEWTSIDVRDPMMLELTERLVRGGALVRTRPGAPCWRIELPGSWEEYLSRLSRSHRKQILQLERRIFASGRAVSQMISDPEDLREALRLLTDLNQRRARQLGTPCCFESQRYLSFHAEVAALLLQAGQLRFQWLQLDSHRIACEYQLAGNGEMYAYQGGFAPEFLPNQPGRLSTIVALREAIEGGFRGYDLLRGDEAYKAHWRARPQATLDLRIWPGAPVDRLRRAATITADEVRRQLRRWRRFAHQLLGANPDRHRAAVDHVAGFDTPWPR